jgi:outer membrane protein OmpA-like peptidoglycan-associated protein
MGAWIVALVGTLIVFLTPDQVGDELVVLLPDANGHVGTLVVERGGERAVLNQAYAASRIVGGSPPRPERISTAETRSEFAIVLGALPEQPKPLPEKPKFQVGDELVVLLPGADGHVGTVVVERRGERTVLNQAYAASRIVGGSPPRGERMSAAEIRSEFAIVLGALPAPPKSFLVYFLEATDEFTAESRVEFEKILTELRERGAPDVVVIGHTDRAGSPEFNDRLSLQRAERVRGELVKLGIPGARIQAAGRGEREPLVLTDDGITEPGNRRVEINVR